MESDVLLGCSSHTTAYCYGCFDDSKIPNEIKKIDWFRCVYCHNWYHSYCHVKETIRTQNPDITEGDLYDRALKTKFTPTNTCICCERIVKMMEGDFGKFLDMCDEKGGDLTDSDIFSIDRKRLQRNLYPT